MKPLYETVLTTLSIAKSKNSPDGMEEENRVFLEPFKDGLSGKYGLFDIKGDFIIEPKFKDARCFSYGLAAVEINGKWGFINTKGEYVVEPKFDNANSFSDGIAWVKIDSKIGYINTKG